MKSKSLKPLAITFALGGIWDTMAGFLYIFVISNGRLIDNPPWQERLLTFPCSAFLWRRKN